MKEYEILSAGHICLDLIPDLSSLKFEAGSFASVFVPGKLLNIGKCSISTGGSVSNTGFALSKYGAKVAFSTRIGNDDFGRIILSEMKKYGNTSGVALSENSHTSYTVVLSSPYADRIFLHCTGTNDEYSSENLPLDMMRKSQLFHFGYPPLMKKVAEQGGSELIKIFRTAKECGCVTSLDMSLPDPDSFYGKLDWIKILEELLPYVDIFLPSLEEAFYMLDKNRYLELKNKAGAGEFAYKLLPSKIEELSLKSLSLGASISALKLGTRGWMMTISDLSKNQGLQKILSTNLELWNKRKLWCPAFKTDNFVGATGSGDCSIAGFLRALSLGMTAEFALKAAVCAGWQNVQRADALSGIRTWKETVELIESGNIATFDPELEGSDWRYDTDLKIWEKLKE